jgi:hypothetical protein
MARIKFGNGVDGIRGSIAGTTFSRNASGAYARSKSSGTNARTSKQIAQRALFSLVAGQWRLLTEAERESFVAQAGAYPQTNTLGETVILTGQQLHNKLNLALAANNEPMLSTCKPPTSARSMTGSVDALTESSMIVSLSSAPGADKVIVEATPGVSAGVTKSNTTSFKKIATLTGSSTTADLESGYVGVYGMKSVGTKIFVRFSVLSIVTGQIAVIGQQTVIVE